MEHIKGRVGPIKRIYHKWKALRTVPFRKKFFVGYDLDGNTFWEFHDPNNPTRLRRIVEYRVKNLPFVDYKLPPQWIVWLKSRRPHHPTLEELVADVRRQQALKGLVRQAEERWKTIPLKSKDSVNDGKSRENPQQYHQHSNVKEEINNIEEVKNLKPQR